MLMLMILLPNLTYSWQLTKALEQWMICISTVIEKDTFPFLLLAQTLQKEMIYISTLIDKDLVSFFTACSNW